MDDLSDDSTETRGLLELAVGGDSAAGDRLLGRHRPAVRAFLANRVGPQLQARLDPSDLVQEVQLEVARRLGEYADRRPMPFRVWVLKTAYQRLLLARRAHRAARRSVGREEALPDGSAAGLAERLAGRFSSPSRQARRAERVALVRRALAELNEADREVLLMRAYEGMPYEAIATLLEMTPQAARQRHGRALLRLSKLLAAAGFDEGDTHD